MFSSSSISLTANSNSLNWFRIKRSTSVPQGEQVSITRDCNQICFTFSRTILNMRMIYAISVMCMSDTPSLSVLG